MRIQNQTDCCKQKREFKHKHASPFQKFCVIAASKSPIANLSTLSWLGLYEYASVWRRDKEQCLKPCRQKQRRERTRGCYTGNNFNLPSRWEWGRFLFCRICSACDSAGHVCACTLRINFWEENEREGCVWRTNKDEINNNKFKKTILCTSNRFEKKMYILYSSFYCILWFFFLPSCSLS